MPLLMGCPSGQNAAPAPLESGTASNTATSSNQKNSGNDDDATSPSTTEDPLVVAKQLLRRGQFDQAKKQLRQALVADPANASAMQMTGEINAMQGQTDAAVSAFQQALSVYERNNNDPDTPSSAAPMALYDALARQWMQVGRPYQAVDVLRRAVKTHPRLAALRADIAGLLGALGFELEAAEHLRWLVQHRAGGVNELVVLTDVSRPQTQAQMANDALTRSPSDLRPLYAQARPLMYEAKYAQAADLLKRVVASHPDFSIARSNLIRCLVEMDAATNPEAPAGGALTDDAKLLEQLTQDVRPAMLRHPPYWIAAGLHARRRGDHQQSIIAFRRAAVLNPNDGEILSLLAESLRRIGKEESAVGLAQRSAQLTQLRENVDAFFAWRRDSQRAALDISASLESLGRLWESVAWVNVALHAGQDPDKRMKPRSTQARTLLTGTTPWQLPAGSIDVIVPESIIAPLDSFSWKRGDDNAESIADGKTTDTGIIQFVDQSQQRGLIHEVRLPPQETRVARGDRTNPNTAPRDANADSEASLWIYQSGSGSVSILDFDLNGFPDVY
ncbi:MAG: tetratricopeptide repeat protein, partial [Planctomycetota bacterium]